MLIIYYSHARNTERFVQRHLLPLMDEHLPSKTHSLGHNPVIRIHAKGPRDGISHLSFPFGDPRIRLEKKVIKELPTSTDVLFVTPTYGQFNHETHRAENFTPAAVTEAIDLFTESRHPSDTDFRTYLAIGGNRTFGKDFAKQDRVFGVDVWLGAPFELSGSDTEAKALIDQIVYDRTAQAAK